MAAESGRYWQHAAARQGRFLVVIVAAAGAAATLRAFGIGLTRGRGPAASGVISTG